MGEATRRRSCICRKSSRQRYAVPPLKKRKKREGPTFALC